MQTIVSTASEPGLVLRVCSGAQRVGHHAAGVGIREADSVFAVALVLALFVPPRGPRACFTMAVNTRRWHTPRIHSAAGKSQRGATAYTCMGVHGAHGRNKTMLVQMVE